MPITTPQSALDPRLQVLLVLVPAVALLVNAAAFFLNAYQTRRTNRASRAALVAAGLKHSMDDPEIQAAFYLIEYGNFKYDAAFHGSEVECRIDKLLRGLADLALLWEGGLLTRKDLSPLRYYYRRV